MDINILLVLQAFRDGIGGFLADFMSRMTFYGETNTVLIIMAVIYWCVSKSFGTYLLMGWGSNRVVNGLMKVTVCAYRPWIKDPRIVPYGDSMKAASGYSFPSGHSMNAASLFGGGMIRKDFSRTLRIVLGVIFALIAFSRIYLGVHTPQDILIGAAAGLLVMWLIAKLIRWIELHPEKDIPVLCIGIGIAAAVAVFAAVKPYPADYDEAGKLLVDGAKMANDTFKGVGRFAGILVGWVLERRLVRFSTDVPGMTKITRLAIGLLGYYVVSLILMTFLKNGIPGAGGAVTSCFLQTFYVSFIFPWCVKHLEQ